MRIFLILSSVIILFGCRTIAPPAVLTEDRAGRALIMTAIPESGPRKDVPTDVAPRHVEATVTTRTGAKVIIVKKPFHKPVVYANEQAVAEGLSVTQPQDPWWKWPVLILIAVGTALVIYFLEHIKRLIFFRRR